MSDNSTDFYHQKTDAELQYFVDHPEFYQLGLIDSARRELQRRGAAAVGAAPVAAAASPMAAPLPVSPSPVSSSPASPVSVPMSSPASPSSTSSPVSAPSTSSPLTYVPMAMPASGGRNGALVLGLAAALLLGGGGFYLMKQKSQPPPPPAAPVKPKAPPRLVEVATSAIPNYDVPAIVARQLAQVPAAERTAATQAGQPMHQYKELVKRFWAAETQTEYLTNQAHAGKTSEVFADQTLLARQTWQDWNKAVAYGYKFGPVMAAQLQHMEEVASSQQHILEMLPDLLPDRKFLTDKELVSREADVQDGLSNLLPTSPVTGQRYEATVVTIKM